MTNTIFKRLLLPALLLALVASFFCTYFSGSSYYRE